MPRTRQGVAMAAEPGGGPPQGTPPRRHHLRGCTFTHPAASLHRAGGGGPAAVRSSNRVANADRAGPWRASRVRRDAERDGAVAVGVALIGTGDPGMVACCRPRSARVDERHINGTGAARATEFGTQRRDGDTTDDERVADSIGTIRTTNALLALIASRLRLRRLTDHPLYDVVPPGHGADEALLRRRGSQPGPGVHSSGRTWSGCATSTAGIGRRIASTRASTSSSASSPGTTSV